MLEKKMEIIRDYYIIPSGVEYGRLWQIEDAISNTYDYNDVKYNEEAVFYNAQIALKINHKLVEKPFWIVVFDGANHWNNANQVVIATWEKPSMDYPILKIDDISLPDNEDFNGKEIIAKIVKAFQYVLFEKDESGLYTDGNEPLTYDYSEVVYEIAQELKEIDFMTIDMTISLNNPNINSVKELGKKYLKVAQCNMYIVYVISNNELKDIYINLTKDEAEILYLQKCHEWYKEGGICAYQKLYIDEDKSMSENDFDEYYGSDQYYESEDNAHVFMGVM